MKAVKEDVPAIVKQQRRIGGLDTIVESALGGPVRTDRNESLTIRAALLICLNSHECSAVESFRVYEIAVRIRAADGAIDLSEADHAFVKDVVQKIGPRAIPGGFALAQVWRAVE
jgi:hypothetical protein